LTWNTKEDIWMMKLITERKLPETKRQILAELMPVFDPLGIFTPVILRAMQIYSQITKEAHGNRDLKISGEMIKE
jgi:Pao retrotransposon peptidase